MMDIFVCVEAHYFSTQGWARGFSLPFFSCLFDPFAAAAFLALMSKKLAIAAVADRWPIQRGKQCLVAVSVLGPGEAACSGLIRRTLFFESSIAVS